MMRLAVVGRGRWGRNIVATLEGWPQVELLAPSRDPQVILAARPEGVLIATPSPTHAEFARPFIEAGLPTFIEKPFTTDVADAEQLRDAALRTGAPVFIGHVHLYNPAFQTLVATLPRIGPLHRVSCQGFSIAPRIDSSILWDWLPHFLAMGRAIGLDPPTHVTARNLAGSDPIASADVRFTCGDVELRIETNWLGNEKRMRFEVIGSRGTTTLHESRPTDKVDLQLADTLTNPSYAPDRPLTCELRAFLDMVESRVQDTRQLELSVSIVREVATAEASARQGGSRLPIG